MGSDVFIIIAIGRHRFVFYARKDFDGSQIPAEWYELVSCCNNLTALDKYDN